MPMTDTDLLSTPADMVGLLKHLTKVMRDVEVLPDSARQRFWDDTNRGLSTVPAEDLRLDSDVSRQSVTVLYSILVNMCGQQLAEMVNGEVKEYYESMITQMKEATHRDWDAFLDQKLDEIKGTNPEGVPAASVALHTLRNIGGGFLKRVDGGSKLLKLTDAVNGRERYFSSKDIIMMEFRRSTPPESK